MAHVIALADHTNSILKEVADDLELVFEKKLSEWEKRKFNRSSATPAKCVNLYLPLDNKIAIPFFYSRSKFSTIPNRDKEHAITTLSFEGELRPAQKKVKNDIVRALNKNGTALLSAHPGFGKTAIGIYIACKIKYVTFVISHRVVIANQWVESFKRFSPGVNVKIANSKTKYDSSVDVYVCNPVNIPKLNPKILSSIGLLIVDEAHCFCSPKNSIMPLYFEPRFVLGLTATPDEHKMGEGVILEHYFSTKDNWVRKSLHAPHTVYRVATEYKYTPKVSSNGRLDWGSIITEQCENKERNQNIVDIIMKFNDRRILVLCKRKNQATQIKKMLDETTHEGEEGGSDSDIYMGSQKFANYDCRVLLTTYSKGGVGFDHPSLNMLIIASDVEAYIGQYHGRIFRGGGSTERQELPVIVDLVDDFSTLVKHWRSRRTYYIQSGAKIVNTNLNKILEK